MSTASDERQQPSDEEQELLEYLEAAKELEAARELEAAEFIREQDSEEDEEAGEPEEGPGDEVQDAPASLIEDAAARRSYWEAQALVELEQDAFAAAIEQDDAAAQRSAYYRLAVYHGRTIYILRSALNAGKEPLAQAAMRNLATLHRAMTQMHQRAPANVPVAFVLDRRGRDEFARDLVMRALQESAEPVELDGIVQRANDLDVMGVAKGTVQRHLKDLIASGHVATAGERPTRYARTQRAYTDMDINAPSLRALVGPDLYARLEEANFAGLNDVAVRQSAFRQRFGEVTGLGQASGALFVDLVETLLEDRAQDAGPWTYTDLIGSPYPRPYQYEAYAVFRGYGYHGQLVEAPTGSGKTMIGMMCVQDWLKNLRAGQSILILVPTSNYLQQWTGELCYKSIGLRLSPEMVFSGTPSQLERFQKRTGSHPAVLLMTYTALAQAGSAHRQGRLRRRLHRDVPAGRQRAVRHPGRGAQGRREPEQRLFRCHPADAGVAARRQPQGTGRLHRHGGGLPCALRQAGAATGLQHPHRRTGGGRLRRPLRRAGRAVLLFGARAAHPRSARQLQGQDQRLHRAGGQRPAARLVRRAAHGRARGHRPRSSEYVRGAQGLAVHPAEAPGGMGVGRQPATDRGEARDHGADRPAVDRRRPGAGSGRRRGSVHATGGRDRRHPRGADGADLPAGDAGAPAEAGLHHPVRRGSHAAGLQRGDQSGRPQRSGQRPPGHHDRRPVRRAQRVVPAGRRRPGRDDQGGDRGGACDAAGERRHHLRQRPPHPVEAGRLRRGGRRARLRRVGRAVRPTAGG